MNVGNLKVKNVGHWNDKFKELVTQQITTAVDTLVAEY